MPTPVYDAQMMVRPRSFKVDLVSPWVLCGQSLDRCHQPQVTLGSALPPLASLKDLRVLLLDNGNVSCITGSYWLFQTVFEQRSSVPNTV